VTAEIGSSVVSLLAEASTETFARTHDALSDASQLGLYYKLASVCSLIDIAGKTF